MYGKNILGAIRSTFLVKDGKVVKVWPSVKVDGHIDAVIAELGGASPSAATSKPKAKTTAKATPKAKAKAKSK
jgi:peroxiredoxin Q/BCP